MNGKWKLQGQDNSLEKQGTNAKRILKAKILFQMFKLWLKASTRTGHLNVYPITQFSSTVIEQENSLDLQSGEVCFSFILSQLCLHHFCSDLPNSSCSIYKFSKHQHRTLLHMQTPLKTPRCWTTLTAQHLLPMTH